MKDFLELCAARYSLRLFADRPVEREKIERCLEAARLAPSASNGQPCRFVVFDDREKKQQLCDAVFTGVFAASHGFARAPVIVALLAKTTVTLGLLARTRGVNYQIVDSGIAGEHFALAAAEQGLGTCWIGWYEPNGLIKYLGLKNQGLVPVALFALGYPPEGQATPAKKRKELKEIAGWNGLPGA
jgi:nitroreductase